MNSAVIEKPPVIETIPEPEWIHCDRDQACDQAKYVALTVHGPLYFCGHHYHENEKALKAKKYVIEAL